MMEDVRCDIDLVVPMVFPQDTEWQRDYERYVGDDGPADHVRYRSWGTEELMVMCCMRFMPWVRRIYILLAQESQVQPWMEDIAAKHTGTEVRLVFHREFIPGKYLPCFSSPCIEMFLHRIPGLSEQFIYANDDMFPLSPLQPEDFFRAAPVSSSCVPMVASDQRSSVKVQGSGDDGGSQPETCSLKPETFWPCQHYDEKAFPEEPNTFHMFVKNGLDMVAAPFGRRFTATWLKNGHSLAPYLKGTCEEVWRRHGGEILRRLNPLRRDAHSYCQYIYGHYQHLAGLYVDHTPRLRYIRQDTPLEQLVGIIRDPEAGIVCLNDNEAIGDWEQRAAAVRREIATRLGEAAAVTRQHTLRNGGGNRQHAQREGVRSGGTDALRIWVSYHRDELAGQYGLKDDDTHRLFATHREPEGESINRLNPVYSEMVTMWHVWRNGLRSGLVGFEHYRRHLRVVRPLPEDGECEVFRCLDFGRQTVYEQYARWHNAKDMDAMLGLLDDRYGDGNAYSLHIRKGHRLIANCSFLMRWEDFTRLCEYLFPLLEDFGRLMGMADGLGTVERWHEKAVRDFGGSRPVYQRRVVSFLAERLISAWIATHMRWHAGIDAAIVHYNTPELTQAAVRSLWKHTPGCRVTVFDNSDARPFAPMDGVTVIDNTKGQVIDFGKWLATFPDKAPTNNGYASAKHCYSIQWLIDHREDPFILMDSDVLVCRDLTPLWDCSKAAVGQVRENAKRYWVRLPLMLPFLCFINVPLLRRHGVTFYDPDHTYALTTRKPNIGYDTGAWFVEDLRRHRMDVGAVDVGEYILHLGSASWKDRPAQAWLEEHRELWEQEADSG